MPKHFVFVKGNIKENEKIPMTAIVSAPLSKQTLDYIESLKYNDAVEYCRKILGFNLLNGHIEDKENSK